MRKSELRLAWCWGPCQSAYESLVETIVVRGKEVRDKLGIVESVERF